MKISIIIPIFGVENYILRCLDSIKQQSFQNYEVILINDCTNDGSINLVEKFILGDNRFRLFHNEKNIGLALTRNKGIKESTGDYIIFVDSDDSLEKEALFEINKNILLSDSEVIIYGNQTYLNRRTWETIPNIDDDRNDFFFEDTVLRTDFFSNIVGSTKFNFGKPNLGYAPWNMAIKSELIKKNNLKFFSERKVLFEDLVFSFDLYNSVRYVRIIREPLYNYILRTDSLSNHFSKEKIEKLTFMDGFITEKYLNIITPTSFVNYINTIAAYLYFFIENCSNVNELAIINNSGVFNKYKKKFDLPIKYKLVFKLLEKEKYNFLLFVIRIRLYIRKLWG